LKKKLMTRWVAVAGIAWAVATLGAGSARAATYGVFAESRLLDTPNTVIRSSESGAVDAFAADVGGPANTHANPSASARVNTAGIHLTAVATAQVFSPGPTASVYSSAEARGGFSDHFSISAPGLVGTAGTVTVAFVLSGAPSNSGGPVPNLDGQGWGSVSSWKAAFNLVGNDHAVRWEGDRSYSLDAFNSITDGNANFGTQSFTLPIVFGSRLDLSFSGTVEVRAGASSTIPGVPATLDAFGALDLGNTLAWGGITDLRDANGVAVTEFDATSSDTGFNYAQAYVAVPEPGTFAILLTGMLGLAARRGARAR
jgi:hypothetical protein